MISTNLGTWVAALLTLFIYSYFVSNKQNILFRFAQATVVGCSLGYIIVLVMVKNVDTLAITRISGGEIILIIPILLGLLMYTKFIPQYSYMARTPIAIIVSVGLAIGARGALETQIVRQVLSTASMPIFGVDIVTSISSLIFIVGLISGSYYFFFTLNPKLADKMKPFSTLGRSFLMIYFGTKFGATIMSRLTLFLGRVSFLIFDWLGFA